MRTFLWGSFFLVACAGKNSAFFDNGAPTTSDGGGLNVTTEGGLIFGDSASSTGNGDCTDAAKLVYLVTAENDLYSFNPGTSALARIGTLDCATTSSPNSMAVDRNAKAYVNMSDGSLFTVDTANAHCSATSYKLNQQNRIIRGMGFSANTSGGSDETLFASTDLANGTIGTTGGGLVSIDVNSFALSTVGDFSNSLAGSECELTGTGDARLFGFFALLNTPDLAEITKTNAATKSPIPLGGVESALAYAFSFWGGDFWFYTSPDGTTPSEVTRYKYSTDKTSSVVIQNTNMVIVGAGVSTCAPLQGPN